MAEAFLPESIEVDLPCTACGYNLRGLTRTGKCPECGQPIDPSMRGDLLQYANPGWLKTVLRGADLMYYSIGIGIIVGVIAGGLTSAGVVGLWLTNVLTVIGGVLNLLAVWLITTQEPRVSFTEQQVTWRRVLRFCAVVNTLCVGLDQGGIWQVHLDLGLALLIAVKVVQGISGLVAVYGYFAYAEGFATRVPDYQLARSTRIVKWGLLVTQLLGLVLAVVMLTVVFGPTGPLAAPGGPPAAAPAAPGAGAAPPAPPAGMGMSMAGFAAVGCFLGIAFLVFGLWALRLLYRYRKVLREALAEAEAAANDSWGRGGAAAYGADG